MPGTQRFSKEARNVEALVAAIEAQFGYPLITRSVLFQQGYGMTRIDDRDMLVKILQTEVQKEFFVTEFVDSRGSSEFYRKIRAVIVGDEIIVARVDYDTSWSVHGRKCRSRVAFCESHPELLAAGRRAGSVAIPIRNWGRRCGNRRCVPSANASAGDLSVSTST